MAPCTGSGGWGDPVAMFLRGGMAKAGWCGARAHGFVYTHAHTRTHTWRVHAVTGGRGSQKPWERAGAGGWSYGPVGSVLLGEHVAQQVGHTVAVAKLIVVPMEREKDTSLSPAPSTLILPNHMQISICVCLSKTCQRRGHNHRVISHHMLMTNVGFLFCDH